MRFKNNVFIEELKTSCSDYNGSYYYEDLYKGDRCEPIILDDTNKYCLLLNNLCTEQYKKCKIIKGIIKHNAKAYFHQIDLIFVYLLIMNVFKKKFLFSI